MNVKYCRLEDVGKLEQYSEITVSPYYSDSDIAEECAKSYYDNDGHEGEVKWPINIRVFFSEERFNDYSVHVDYSPNFYAYDI